MTPTREPLVIRAAVVAAATGLLHAAVLLGFLPVTPDAEAAVAGVFDLIGTAVLVIWTRGKVTPVADPMVPAPLVPAVPASSISLESVPDGDGEHRADVGND